MARAFLLLLLGPAAFGCDPPSSETSDVVDRGGEKEVPVSKGNVEQAVNESCSTSSIKPLSQQIIDEMLCIAPDDFVVLPERANLKCGAPVFPYLVAPARDRLLEVLDESFGKTMTVNSMFRTVAEQYMLRRWYEGDCFPYGDGQTCEESLNWFGSGSDRFGCGARLRVSAGGKSAVVVVVDSGPACWVEQEVGTGVLSLSYRTIEYLFGDTSAGEATVHVEEADLYEPLGPAD